MVSKTVKIVEFHQVGGPEVLKLKDTPLPEPGHGRSSFACSCHWPKSR